MINEINDYINYLKIERQLSNNTIDSYKRDLDEFKKVSDVVIANRLDDSIKDIKSKIYTRDLFARD